MKKNIQTIYKGTKKALALMLSLSLCTGLIAVPEFAGSSQLTLISYADSRSAVINTDRVNVRSGPGTSNSKVATLTAGTAVTVTGETKGSDGYTWYSISWNGGSGYARYDYVAVTQVYAASDAAFEQQLSAQGFPESYKNGLRGLHQKYPNWTFTAQKTGLDWNTVITEESKIGRNLVASTSISSWKSIETGAFDWANNYWPGFDGATWVQSSKSLIEYYMDPRNFLSDPYIFQFEVQTYDASKQTKAGLEKLVAGTFLEGDAIVPIEGSVIDGGTVIEGSVANLSGGTGSSTVSTSSSSTAAGPGGSSSTSTNVIGPGTTLGPGSTSSSSSTSSSAVITAPGVTADNKLSSGFAALGELAGNITAYANWQTDAAGKWVYYDASSGGNLNNGWNWLDGNNDGTAECYYFYSDGSLAVSTVVDGYKVDADGKWIDDNGNIQTKSVSSSSTPSAAPQLKKVPYVDIIMKAASESGVSPYVLAAAILQEQGKGTSDLISGTNSTYPGYYNFFNTGAYAHDGLTAVQAGLKYASESGTGDRPWNTIEKAIIGGAKMYGANYVNNGQDTFYLKKFNVQGSNKYNHQFMTHVIAAASEGAKVSNAYTSDMKQTTLTFKIPVYENMPESTTLPSGDGNPNNKLKSLSVDGYVITPTFNMDTESYTLIVDGSSANVNINAVTIDSGAAVTGAGNVALNVGNNDVNVVVKAANGSERTYKLSITRRDNITATDTTDSTASSTVTNGPGAIISGTTTGPGATGSSSVIGPGSTASATVSGTQTTESTTSVTADGVIIGAGPAG